MSFTVSLHCALADSASAPTILGPEVHGLTPIGVRSVLLPDEEWVVFAARGFARELAAVVAFTGAYDPDRSLPLLAALMVRDCVPYDFAPVLTEQPLGWRLIHVPQFPSPALSAVEAAESVFHGAWHASLFRGIYFALKDLVAKHVRDVGALRNAPAGLAETEAAQDAA